MDDVFPDWWEDPTVEPGMYIWPTKVIFFESRDLETEKPFILLRMEVIDGPQQRFQFDFRLYISKKAKGWATYFLKKFEYPPELLDGDKPVIRKSKTEGLTGKMLVQVYDDQFGRKYDAKGFDHLSGTELEEREQKKQEVPIETSGENLPAVDVEGDIKGVGSLPTPNEDLFSVLDGNDNATAHGWQGRDDPLPPIFYDEQPMREPGED